MSLLTHCSFHQIIIFIIVATANPIDTAGHADPASSSSSSTASTVFVMIVRGSAIVARWRFIVVVRIVRRDVGIPTVNDATAATVVVTVAASTDWIVVRVTFVQIVVVMVAMCGTVTRLYGLRK